jgi:predicted nuclease of predicted toxin-antitoxin system
MRFLVDANLPRSTLAAFARSGHQASHVNDVGLKDARDELIAQRARETQAAIVTRDLDFSDIRTYPPADYAGIVVMRVSDDTVATEIVQILERFLTRVEIVDQLPGHLAIVEAHQFRFRPGLK